MTQWKVTYADGIATYFAATDWGIGQTDAGGQIAFQMAALVHAQSDGDYWVGAWGAGVNRGLGIKFSTFYELGLRVDTDNRETAVVAKAADETGFVGFWTGSTPTRRVLIDNGGIRPNADDTYDIGTASFRWDDIYATNTTIQTSDEREKEQIGAIPDAWLDAWADVEWVRYKWISAVADKGEEARWHTGLVAQSVYAAFAAHGFDAFEIGLLCHDVWAETPAQEAVEEEHDEAGEVTVPGRAAMPAIPGGDRWGIRIGECIAIEAAYQRRRMAAIEARLSALEGGA